MVNYLNLAQRLKIVPVGNYEDINADYACDSINMSGFHRAMFIVLIHATAVSACYIKLYSGATDGALDSALTFNYAFGSAAQGSASCDVLGTEAQSANLSFAATTKDDYMLIIEVDASAMDVANGEEWLTLKFLDTDTGLTGRVSVVAVLEQRYAGENLTALE
jgi:hypothetical protein